MNRRILVCGLWHETNSFSPIPTDLDAFRAFVYVTGDTVLERHEQTNTEIGGFMREAERHRMTLVPALYAGAVPSGTIVCSAFEALLDETIAIANANVPFDGALVALHGAMHAEGHPQAEVEYLERLRRLLGPRCPIVATFDLHANLSRALFDLTDVLVGYDTYPHVDMSARGAEAAVLMAGILDSGQSPAGHYRKLPLLTVPQVQETNAHPASELIAELHEAERGPLTTGSIALGFPYTDVAHLGVTVVGYGKRPDAVRDVVDRLADSVWRARERFVPRVEPCEAAIDGALASAHGPVVLVDVADNVGGGSPGDGTVILERLIAARAHSGAIVLWDREAAPAAVAIGAGGTFSGPVGGMSDARHGSPVVIEGTIRFADRLVYSRSSSYMTGLPVDLGRVAVVDVGGLQVMLTEQRAMPFDADHLRAAGISPRSQQLLVVKSAIGWKAAFADIAADHLYVDTPGACASDLRRLQYTQGANRLYPIDPDPLY